MNVRRIGRLSLILILCLSAAACSGSLFRNYGRINPNNEVTQAFEGYRVNGEFRYYVSGAHHYPNALMGLHRDQRLDPSTLWREVPGMTAATMKEIVDQMKAKASQHNMFQYGFEMLDNQGWSIGVWYSVLSARTFLRMNEDGTVRIDTPDLDIYERLERDAHAETDDSRD
ncbi:MAG: hypothetical protein A3J94_08930 [Syntrophus sp. RIFOXYC2_FULL_54_9]|nr:MAG: hypothetical protein A3J94_08930 [Syntrophus sp. RIFOXYC2_FULL_54_9]